MIQDLYLCYYPDYITLQFATLFLHFAICYTRIKHLIALVYVELFVILNKNKPTNQQIKPTKIGIAFTSAFSHVSINWGKF